jgi:hypothetical protein
MLVRSLSLRYPCFSRCISAARNSSSAMASAQAGSSVTGPESRRVAAEVTTTASPATSGASTSGPLAARARCVGTAIGPVIPVGVVRCASDARWR